MGRKVPISQTDSLTREAENMLINEFTPKQQRILRQLDVGQYAGHTRIAHASARDPHKNYYVIHIDVKSKTWKYQKDEPIRPSEVADLLKAGGLLTTKIRHQYVLNPAVFSQPVRRFLKRWQQVVTSSHKKHQG